MNNVKYLPFLQTVIVYARYLGYSKASSEQIADLLDAIHFLPELIGKTEAIDKRAISDILEAYDNKWVKKDSDFSLIKLLDEI